MRAQLEQARTRLCSLALQLHANMERVRVNAAEVLTAVSQAGACSDGQKLGLEELAASLARAEVQKLSSLESEAEAADALISTTDDLLAMPATVDEAAALAAIAQAEQFAIKGPTHAIYFIPAKVQPRPGCAIGHILSVGDPTTTAMESTPVFFAVGESLSFNVLVQTYVEGEAVSAALLADLIPCLRVIATLEFMPDAPAAQTRSVTQFVPDVTMAVDFTRSAITVTLGLGDWGSCVRCCAAADVSITLTIYAFESSSVPLSAELRMPLACRHRAPHRVDAWALRAALPCVHLHPASIATPSQVEPAARSRGADAVIVPVSSAAESKPTEGGEGRGASVVIPEGFEGPNCRHPSCCEQEFPLNSLGADDSAMAGAGAVDPVAGMTVSVWEGGWVGGRLAFRNASSLGSRRQPLHASQARRMLSLRLLLRVSSRATSPTH